MTKGKRKTTEEFIHDARYIHGEKYIYDNVNYINAHTKVKIICREHDEFLMKPNDHLSKHGCQKCANDAKRKTKEEFIKKASKIHNNKYDYSFIDYINAHTKVKIICKDHGEFLQTPNGHLSKKGCFKCAGNEHKTKEEFIKKASKIHNNKYIYDSVDYINDCIKIKIICKDHGEFLQTPSKHLQKQGCPLCVNKTEGKLSNFLLSLYPSLISQGRYQWCKSSITEYYYSFDFVLEEYKLIIELDGKQHFNNMDHWYSEVSKVRSRDIYKIKCALENGYSIIHLSQMDVFNDKNNWENKLIESIKMYDEPTAIFIENDSNYGPHIEEALRDKDFELVDINFNYEKLL